MDILFSSLLLIKQKYNNEMHCNLAKILFHQETKKNSDSSFECHQCLSNEISYTERNI